METDKPLDRLSMDEVMDWLMNLGFSVEVQHAFQGKLTVHSIAIYARVAIHDETFTAF